LSQDHVQSQISISDIDRKCIATALLFWRPVKHGMFCWQSKFYCSGNQIKWDKFELSLSIISNQDVKWKSGQFPSKKQFMLWYLFLSLSVGTKNAKCKYFDNCFFFVFVTITIASFYFHVSVNTWCWNLHNPATFSSNLKVTTLTLHYI